MGTEGSRTSLDSSANCRRQLRPAKFGLVVLCDDRPRYGLPLRSDGPGRRFCAVRRVWPASSLRHVQVDQPISRGAGVAATVVVEPELSEYDLRADAERHGRPALDFCPLHAGDYAGPAAPSGTVSRYDVVVQPRGKYFAKRCDRC